MDEAEKYYSMVEYRKPSQNPAVFSSALKNLGIIQWHKGHLQRAEYLLECALAAVETTENEAIVSINTMLTGLRNKMAPPPMPSVRVNTNVK